MKTKLIYLLQTAASGALAGVASNATGVVPSQYALLVGLVAAALQGLLTRTTLNTNPDGTPATQAFQQPK